MNTTREIDVTINMSPIMVVFIFSICEFDLLREIDIINVRLIIIVFIPQSDLPRNR